MNSVSLIGRLTKDPDIRYGAASQTAIARFSIAIDGEVLALREVLSPVDADHPSV